MTARPVPCDAQGVESLVYHVKHICNMLDIGASTASEALPARGADEETLICDRVNREHFRDIMLDLQVPRDLEPRRAAISQALDDQARNIDLRLERRSRQRAYAARR